MTNTRTRSRATHRHTTNRHTSSHVPITTRAAIKSLRQNYGGVATKARRSYRRARRAMAQHPRISVAFIVAGVGLVAGVLFGLATRGRGLAQRPTMFWPSSLSAG